MEYNFFEENENFEEDEVEGRTRVSVKTPLGTGLALKSVLEQHQAWAQQLQAHHKARLKNLNPAQRGDLMAEQYLELRTLRRQGELLDTRDALVAFGLRQEVQARGWDHPWPDVDLVEIPLGRFPGGTGTGSYPETLSLRLPGMLVDQVSAGCWSTSKESIHRLWQWRDDHAPAVLRPHATRPEEQAAAAEYQRLSAGVTTTGEVYRAGIHRGLRAALHTPPPSLITALAPR
ncbi:hypothetical protein [Streptomyces mangrovisoli]|uniref:Uncharacterized protein n=1 Tax=Streptomyces mangrovisoli TaxID=1428628 RepID=A0A1J4NNS9_9ACTN|nr:hypothetical protein [Streptomyces mangrovisoli]OIJ63252.1 hypothetical protein WN71_035100 [Streptomyces mangrovisoli]